MDHLQPEQLQHYLAGSMELPEGAQVEAHLATCSQCEALLEAIVADDAALGEALALLPEEAAWIEAQDLRPAVARRIAPWYRQAQGLLLLILLAAAGWKLQETASQITGALDSVGPFTIGLALLKGLGQVAGGFLNYLGSSGPLITLVLLGALTLWIQRRKHSDA